jgi:AraC-like DNA-binding protein
MELLNPNMERVGHPFRIDEDEPVPGNRHNPPSTLVDATFRSMEEINELSRSIGREGEYHQLGKGRVTSQWRSLHIGRTALTSHRADQRIHAHLTPPRGCVILAIVPPSHFMLVDGVAFGNDKVLVMDANSEVDFVTPVKGACDTLGLPECDFKASVQTLFPRFRLRTIGGLNRILQCPSSGWSALQREMTNLLQTGSMSPEDFSRLLCRFIDLMVEEPEKRQREACPGKRPTGSVARRAREYIEDHYHGTIRMEDLCRCTGASMRTVQRAFSEYFQMSPFDYIKARRLNAARQDLLAGEASLDTVTRIAVENGFTHLGRFSVGYREHFNELPRETLAREGR